MQRDITILWCHIYNNGPWSGLCVKGGKKLWFNTNHNKVDQNKVDQDSVPSIDLNKILDSKSPLNDFSQDLTKALDLAKVLDPDSDDEFAIAFKEQPSRSIDLREANPYRICVPKSDQKLFQLWDLGPNLSKVEANHIEYCRATGAPILYGQPHITADARVRTYKHTIDADQSLPDKTLIESDIPVSRFANYYIPHEIK